MARRKIALIGNSGTGKSECVKRLGGDLGTADMDGHLDFFACPSYEKVLAWVLDGTPGQDVVAVSAHLRMLERTRDAKGARLQADRFAQVLFVHLCNSDPAKRREFLERPNAQGTPRGRDHVEAVLGQHDWACAACKDLADVTIDAARVDMEEVATMVAALRDALIRRGG